MGTDYPYDMGEIDPIGFIESAQALDDTKRRLVFGGNGAEHARCAQPQRRSLTWRRPSLGATAAQGAGRIRNGPAFFAGQPGLRNLSM